MSYIYTLIWFLIRRVGSSFYHSVHPISVTVVTGYKGIAVTTVTAVRLMYAASDQYGMDAETARIGREMDVEVAVSLIKPGTHPFTDKRGVPFIFEYVLFIDPKDPDCIEAERYLRSKGIRLDAVDVTDYDGELIFNPVPLEIDAVPVLYTKKGTWYSGVESIKEARL